MTSSLPDSVTRYFEISNGADIAGLPECFTSEALVFDEGQTHHGQDAIGSWIQEARSKATYSVEPTGASWDGEQGTVTADVVGNFPGSPVSLEHAFTLAHGKIQSLRIG